MGPLSRLVEFSLPVAGACGPRIFTDRACVRLVSVGALSTEQKATTGLLAVRSPGER